MTTTTRRRVLLLLGLVMAITVVLAASLSSLELQPGMPLPEIENGQMMVGGAPEQPVVQVSINRFFFILIGIFVAAGLVYMLIAALRGTNWRSIFSLLRILLGIGLLMFSVLIIILLMPRGNSVAEAQAPLPTPAPIVTAPLGPVPPLLLWIAGFCLLVIGTLIVVWIIRTATNHPTTIDLLSLEAEKARQDIEIGVGLKDVIIKCYRKMSLALEKEQGIERKKFMTTGEFEKLLAEAGIPSGPIQQLTALFEAARYGNWQPGQADEENAIHCLEAIIEYSRAVKAARESK